MGARDPNSFCPRVLIRGKLPRPKRHVYLVHHTTKGIRIAVSPLWRANIHRPSRSSIEGAYIFQSIRTCARSLLNFVFVNKKGYVMTNQHRSKLQTHDLSDSNSNSSLEA